MCAEKKERKKEGGGIARGLSGLLAGRRGGKDFNVLVMWIVWDSLFAVNGEIKKIKKWLQRVFERKIDTRQWKKKKKTEYDAPNEYATIEYIIAGVWLLKVCQWAC